MQCAARQLQLFTDVDQAGESPGYSIRESGRARRLSIKVFPRGKVEVVVPRRTPPGDVQAFISSNRSWIEQTRVAFARTHPPESFSLPRSIDLPAVARRVQVRYERPQAGASVRYRAGNGVLVLRGRTDDDALCVRALKRWLASVAKKEFEPRLRALAAHTGDSYERMQVRGQRSCWGSHSSSGTISLNYCLLFLEPALLRYLLIHELCHASHMNHSRRFWNRVRCFEPNYLKLDKALGDAWYEIPIWLGFN